jgi:hypothetical protein
MNDKSLSWLVATLGVSVILLLLGASTVLVRTSEQVGRLAGPYAVDVAPDQTLYALTGSHVIRLNASGELVGKYDLPSTGDGGIFSDVAVLADTHVLLADPGARALLRCEAAVERCAPLALKNNEGQSYVLPPAFAEPFRMAVDLAGDRVFLLAPKAGHVVVISAAGTYLGTLGEGFVGASDVAWDTEGRLMVADTDRQRVVIYNVDAALNASLATEISTQTELSRLQRTYPVAVARAPDGRYWTVVADRRWQGSDVIIFDSSRSPYARVVLDSQARPRALVPTVSEMVVADPDDVQVLSVSFLGEFLDNFSSPSLYSLFAEMADAKTTLSQRRLYAWLGIIGAVMLVPLWVFLRWSRGLAHIQTPDLPGVRWFAPSAIYRRRVGAAMFCYFIALVAGFATIVSVFGGQVLAVELMLAFALIFALPALAFSYFLTVLAATRIGLGDGQVVFMDHRARVARGLPDRVVFNGTTAILDDVAISIRGGGIGHVYGGAEFDSQVLALIQKSAKGFSWAMEWQLIKLRHPPALVTYLVTLPVGIAAMMLGLLT